MRNLAVVTKVSGDAPTTDLAIFAAFLFRKTCSAFSRGLVTQQGMSALRDAIASWKRGRGRPRRGDTTLPKWEACDALMKAAGLPGTGHDSLEKDWQDWATARSDRAAKK